MKKTFIYKIFIWVMSKFHKTCQEHYNFYDPNSDTKYRHVAKRKCKGCPYETLENNEYGCQITKIFRQYSKSVPAYWQDLEKLQK